MPGNIKDEEQICKLKLLQKQRHKVTQIEISQQKSASLLNKRFPSRKGSSLLQSESWIVSNIKKARKGISESSWLSMIFDVLNNYCCWVLMQTTQTVLNIDSSQYQTALSCYTFVSKCCWLSQKLPQQRHKREER